MKGFEWSMKNDRCQLDKMFSGLKLCKLAFWVVLLTGPAFGSSGFSLDFQDYEVTPTFSGISKWRARKGDPSKCYAIEQEDGNRYLHAHSNGKGVQFGLKTSISLSQFPVLTWRWRVHEFPTYGIGPDQDRHKAKESDSAAGVYVLFFRQFQLVPDVIKYVWSKDLPTDFEKTRVGKLNTVHTLVIRSGDTGKGVWQNVRRNVAADYKRFFGKAKRVRIGGIAFLTDSDASKSRASADYDDFLATNDVL